MIDLNSASIEGIATSTKPKRDRSGLWFERPHTGAPPAAFTIERRIRVAGSLLRESRFGPFVLGELIEFREDKLEVPG